MHSNVHCSTIYNSQDMKAIQNVYQQMDKEDVVCMCVHAYISISIYNGILFSHKKWNNAICNNMDGPRDYHTKSENHKSYDTT